MLLNNKLVTEEIKRKYKYLETNENGNTTIRNLWERSKSSSKREVYSDTSLPQETIQISNNLTLHLKKLEKEE